MPAHFYQPISRKTFFKQSAALMGALSLGSSLYAHASSPQKTLHYALISDTHVSEDKNNEYRKFFPYQNLQKVVKQLDQHAFDGMIINGDVARLEGKLGDYQNVKGLLKGQAAKAPIHMGMGNHDDREPFYQTFTDAQQGKVEDKHVSVIESDVVRIIILDSLLYVNKVAGLLGQTQREWLADFLSTSDTKPTVLFVHHTLEDGDTDLLDAQRMFDILASHQQVKAVFYGHSHRFHMEERQNLHLVNLPAVGYNFTDDQPIGWVDAVFDEKGVKLTLHAIGGNMDKNGQLTELKWRT